MSSTPFDLTATAARTAASAVSRARVRLQAIDVMRGFVMVLMTLDHARHYLTNAHFEPLDPDVTHVSLYLTRWITHLCAPTFVFLAGVSAFLMSDRLTPAQLSRFLLTRGLWLIALELSVIGFGWTFDVTFANGFFLQVIWAIGGSMVAMAALVHLPFRAVLTIALLIIAGHNLLDGIDPAAFGAWAPVWNLVHAAGPVPFGFVAYPVLPWIGVMALGYCAGGLYRIDAPTRGRVLIAAGLIALALFFTLRLINVYGDPGPWTERATLEQTLYAFFNLQKYPPSLMYILATLGLASLLLACWERLESSERAVGIRSVLRTFGRVPLFFYVLHIVLAHLTAAAIGWISGFGTEGLLVHNLFRLPEGWGFDLPIVYALWIAILLVCYPLCAWFCHLKERRTDWWLSYL